MSSSDHQRLLDEYHLDDIEHEEPGVSRDASLAANPPWSARRFYVFIIFLKVALSLWTYIPELPLIRLVEAAICRRHYGVSSSSLDQWGDVGEDACKLAVIQDKLAHIMGFKLAFDAIPGLLTSVIYGSLSDKHGRRIVLVLACIGEALNLLWVLFICSTEYPIPIEVLWLGGFCNFVGGGPRVVFAMFFTMAADAIPSSRRTFILFLLHATAQWCRLFSPLIAGKLMDQNLWPPFVLAFSAMLASLAFTGALPETAFIYRMPSNTMPRLETTFKPILKRIKIMLQHSGLRLVFAAFVIKRIAFTSESFIFQYASERLKRKLSQTAIVNFSNNVGATFVTSLALPAISYHWSTRGTQGPPKDVWICRISLLIGDIGFAMLWKSYSLTIMCISMVVCGAAEGLEPALQSIGAAIVGQDLNASFFTFVSVLDTVAQLLGGPIMSALFIIRDDDGLPAGYCYIFSLILFSILFFSSWSVNTREITRKTSFR